MSDQDQGFSVSAGRISAEALEQIHPELADYQVTIDDDDTGECWVANKDDVRHMYVDNAIEASPVQPDVWTLEIEDEYITLTYSNGAQANIRIGDISMDFGAGATRYRKYDGVIYPTDDGGNVLLNAEATPRLANMRSYLHEELARRAEERLEYAVIVYQFAQILQLNTNAF